jgi:hypothetical protein
MAIATINRTNTTTKTNLTRASNQWSTRPADERFWDLPEFIAATKKIDAGRKAVVLPTKSLVADYSEDGGLLFRAKGLEKPTALTHWATNLLLARIAAPARYIRALPPELAAKLINHGLQNSPHWDDEHKARLSIRNDTFTPHIEAFTSDRYGYIPNWKIGEGLQGLVAKGWRVPPARPAGKTNERVRKATKDDVLLNSKFHGLGVKVGDDIAPAGLYASDRDMFAFLVHEKNSVDVKDFSLNRGIWVENSEVGSGAFRITTFLYDAVCGNHIVWGAKDVTELVVRHIGKAEPRMVETMGDKLSGVLTYDNTDVAKKIAAAQKTFLGKNRSEVVEAVYSNRRVHLSQDDAGKAFDLAEAHDAKRTDPTTVWGMICGLTRLSQLESNSDDRARMDQSVPMLMAMAN